MRTKATTLVGALMAGLIGGSAALADPSPSPSATPAQRKPHDGIINKMACCKNGCDCLNAKKAESKPPQPKNKTKD